MGKKLFLLCLLYIQFSYAQDQHRIDSLNSLLKTAKEDTNQLNVLTELARELQYTDIAKVTGYCDKVIALSDKLNATLYKTSAYSIMGVAYASTGNYKKGREYFTRAYELNVREKNLKNQATALNNIGITYYYEGEYKKSLDSYLQSLQIMEKLKDKTGIANAYGNIGNVYRDMSQPELAIENYQKSYAINKETGDEVAQAIDLTNMASIYAQSLKQPGIAKEKINEAIRIYRKNNNSSGYSIALMDLAEVQMLTEEYGSSLKNLIEAKQNFEKAGNKARLAQIYQNIGLCYIKSGQFKQAEQSLVKGIELAKENELKLVEGGGYRDLAACYSKMGNDAKAYKYSMLYAAAKDSLFTNESSRQIADM